MITAKTLVDYKVVFDEPVTEEEVMERFEEDNYEDVTDEVSSPTSR